MRAKRWVIASPDTERVRVLSRETGYTPVSYTHLDVYKRQHLHRIAHADALEEGRQDDRADDAGDDNRNRGDGGYAAEHFGYRDRNRSCYRFRHERCV